MVQPYIFSRFQKAREIRFGVIADLVKTVINAYKEFY